MKKSTVLTLINPKFLKGVAHRGLHNDKLTENSVLSFDNAIKNDYAFELDVHLSKDKKLIVCHDSSLKRITNKDGIIEELTLDEIKNNYILGDGSKIPTLEEVLELNDERVPIVIELKPYKKNYKELSEKVISALKVIRDKRNIIIISFFPQCLIPFKKEKYIRCLLLLYKRRYLYLLRYLFEGLDIEYTIFKNKKFQKAKDKKLILTWTINSKESFDIAKNYADSLTFENLDLREMESN